MRFVPGFVQSLQGDLQQVRSDYQARVDRPGGLSGEKLVQLVSRPSDEQVVLPDHPTERDVVFYEGLNDGRLAREAALKGEVGFIILGGGSGTRAGGPKALLKLPGLGMTLLAQKLLMCHINREFLPTFIMASPAITNDLALHVANLTPTPVGCIFEQFESYRLSPDNRLIFDAPGVPQLYPTGHGDVGPALRASGVLADWPNIKHFIIVNVDNLFATPNETVLHHHIETGAQVTCEITEREEHDKGGVVAWVDNKLQVVENFRVDESFLEAALYHNTNTLIVKREVLEAELDWRWYRVRKQVNNRLVVQHERLIQQYTEAFHTEFVVVPADLRYLPVKDEATLQRAAKRVNGNVVR